MHNFILRIFRPSEMIFIFAFLLLLPFLFYVTMVLDNSVTRIRPKNEPTENLGKMSNFMPKLRIDNSNKTLVWHELLTNASKMSEKRTTTIDVKGIKIADLTRNDNVSVNRNSTAIHGNDNPIKFVDPPNATNVDYVIIVQVHDRLTYLNELIKSLSKVASIERVLLVFSCDLNNEQINALIRQINFCRTLQIAFPFSIQYYANEFPGPDIKPIPNCNGTNCTIGVQQRQMQLAQIKHHWWWKLNYMFEIIMPKFGLTDKFLLLLEEDHIVSPDFLHTFRLIAATRNNICPQCELLCMGTYPKKFNNYAANADKLGVEVWYSSKNNLGMAIDWQLWRQIQNCSKFFCSWDDYNWDWTLLQLSVKCLPKRLEVIYTIAPRVIHVGDCGIHWRKCEHERRSLDFAINLFKKVNSSLFPSKLEVSHVHPFMAAMPANANGGWADPRDHRLCELNTHPSAVTSVQRQIIEEARTVTNGKRN